MQADHCVFVKKFDGGDFLILLTVCGQHVDRQTRPFQDQNAEEGLELVLLNQRYGFSETHPRNAHNLGSNEEVVMAITSEVRDKGASKVHVECETDRIDTSVKL